MIRRFGPEKLVARGDRRFAAVVCIRRGGALALFTAVGGGWRGRRVREAVKWPNEHQYCHKARRNVNAAPHLDSG